jgi:4-hydroxy-tetrahydrodipicolinate reductase
MKLALIGYGKMGRLIDSLASEYDCEVVVRLDEASNLGQAGLVPEQFADVDVAIDFSTPEAACENIIRTAELGVDLVVGTTGWSDRLDEIKAVVERFGVGLVWSPNFSVGVNLFFRLVEEAARLLSDQREYEAWAYEIHHSAKLDAPSGTLLKLVERMKEAGYTAGIDVSSNRAGRIPGTHEIGFDSAADTITLRHTARNREGFARGALQAAKWIKGKKGVFEFGATAFQ